MPARQVCRSLAAGLVLDQRRLSWLKNAIRAGISL